MANTPAEREAIVLERMTNPLTSELYDIIEWAEDPRDEGFCDKAMRVTYNCVKRELEAAEIDRLNVEAGALIVADATLEFPVVTPDGLLAPRAKS